MRLGRLSLLTGLLCGLSLASTSATAQPPAAPSAERPPRGPDAAWYAKPGEAPSPVDPATYRLTSFYITVRDGVRLAANLYLPASKAPAERLPTLFQQTRYWRASGMKRGSNSTCVNATFPDPGYFAAQGYAYLVIDVRGSGASFGTRSSEFSAAELADSRDVLDWITRQPWSNGKVGLLGISYTGTAAELTATLHHPAVKAVAPTFAGFDLYQDINFPGGVRLSLFTDSWGKRNAALDRNDLVAMKASPQVSGPCPVDEDKDGRLLSAAIAEHAQNVDSTEGLSTAQFRDDRSNGLRVDGVSPFWRIKALKDARVPVYILSGWYDGGYSRSAVNRYANIARADVRLTLGPWQHGGSFFGEPGFDRKLLAGFEQRRELTRFFDYYLRSKDVDGFSKEAPVHYFTTGLDRWRSAPTWPPANARKQVWGLRTGGGLAPGLGRQRLGSNDTYTVDPTASAGDQTSRWRFATGTPALYADRRDADKRLLTYTSAPLSAPLEVTGQPVVKLRLAADAPDAAVFVYLEEVRPDGRVDYVGEGELRLADRRVGSPLYKSVAPTHPFRRSDATLAKPGAYQTLTIDVFPISHQFSQGSRLRIAIAGADAGVFAPLAGASRRFSLAANQSLIELPSTP